MAEDIEIDIESIITRLLEGEETKLPGLWLQVRVACKIPFLLSVARGTRAIKTVQLSENEVRGLCHKSREIFLNQPILLELDAPLKVCGKKTPPSSLSLFTYSSSIYT